MSNADGAGVGARAIRATGPGGDAAASRAAYLDLLKLALCDLTGATTREVRWTGDKRWFSRELTEEDQLAGRALGKDWSLNGLSMIGLARLDDLQARVESVVADGVEGDLIEAGVWRGGASILIRATLDSLGAEDRTLWLADSFEGFPEPEADDPDADQVVEADLTGVDFLAPGVDAVRSYFERFGLGHGLRFVPGFFEDTLGALAGRRWSLIRLDADTYSATQEALEALYPGLNRGGYVVLDDVFHPWLPACRRAVDEFREARGITAPLHQVDWNGGWWRKEEEATPGEAAPAEALQRFEREPGPSKWPPRIATDRELQLGDELAAARAELERVSAELAALKAAPLQRVQTRAREWVQARRS